MVRAADYADEWFHVQGAKGPVALRVFYVCRRKCGWEERCATLIVSSRWNRKHDDPLATRQRWYCTVCQAAYKTESGTLVQMVHEGNTWYCRAECPDHNFKLIKATSVQREHDHAATPEALLNAIPEAALYTEPWIKPVEDKLGTYVFDETVFESVPACSGPSSRPTASSLRTGCCPPRPPFPSGAGGRRLSSSRRRGRPCSSRRRASAARNTSEVPGAGAAPPRRCVRGPRPRFFCHSRGVKFACSLS